MSEVCIADRIEKRPRHGHLSINKSECLRGNNHAIAEPYPVNFDSDTCHGCSFWWICQMINTNRKRQGIEDVK